MQSRPVPRTMLLVILVLSIVSPVWAGAAVFSQETAAPSAAPAPSSLANVTYEQMKPSDNLAEFARSAFVIGYPANWKASGEGTSFRIAPAEGAAQEVIAYGVVISTAPSSGSLADATEALVQALGKSNPGMHAVDTPRKIRVGTVRGRAVNLAGSSPVQRNGQSLPEHDWLVTLPRPDGEMLYLVFIAPEGDFRQLRPTYEKMLQSVQVK